MKSPPPTRPAHLRLLLCVLLLCASGCAHAVNTGLGLLGVDTPEPAAPGGVGNDGLTTVRRPEGVGLTGYQHGPTLDWTTLSLGQPVSLARSLMGGMRPEGDCLVVPRGLSAVMPVPYGATGVPLVRAGIFEVGVAGSIPPLGPLLAGDAGAVGLQAVATSANLTAQGRSCGYSIFAQLRLGRSGDPVMVLR